jgi:antitoxin PrlF
MPANARSHAVLTTESKVTIRGQTTIPAPVREALKLKPGLDSIHYEILPGGQVFMCRLGDEQEDHTMNAFLRFLDADIQNNPQITRPFNIQHSTFNIQHSTFNKERNLSQAWTSTLMMRLATTNNGFSTKG